MIKINLLPPEERVEKKVRITLPPVGIYEIIGTIVLGVSVLWLLFSCSVSRAKIAGLNKEIKEYQREIDKLRPVVEKVNRLENRKRDIKKKVNVVKALLRKTTVEVRILDELSKSVPKYVWLKNVTRTGPNLKIEGGAFSNLFIADFIENLKLSPVFGENIILEKISASKEKDVEFLVFSLQVPIESGILPVEGVPPSRVQKTAGKRGG
jgi:Tfp pilus assembly protein PilN